MNVVRCLAERAFLPDEPAVDRTRKELVAPVYVILGTVATIWLLVTVPSLVFGSTLEVISSALTAASLLVVGAALLPAGLYVVRTQRITLRLCELPVLGAALGVILLDAAYALHGIPSVVSLNVLALDCLLLCAASDGMTKAVVTITAAWICIGAVVEREVLSAEGCFGEVPRFSGTYFRFTLGAICARLAILLVDFQFTRGFARSMYEQKALIEASIRVSEMAAVKLSRYETEDTQALLKGADGERLPEGLRAALLQLVANLALYRPYLPQSCLPGNDGSEDDEDDGEGTCVASVSHHSGLPSPSHARRISKSAHESSISLADSESERMRPAAADARIRRVSLLAVNSKSFLDTVEDRGTPAASSFVRCRVGMFAGHVAVERGVVDLVSGDHLFANFNAARMCTTHRVSAVRVAWTMAREWAESPSTAGGQGRHAGTGSVCSGSVLCGDFGTSDVRRFMLLGPIPNTLQCLERVAARMDAVLLDECAGADADVKSSFLTVLVERLCYAKRGPKPFLVWQLASTRERDGGPDEWMYELERQEPNPYDGWNRKMQNWLEFKSSEEDGFLIPSMATLLAGPRQQSHLVDAAVVGETVAACTEVLSHRHSIQC